MLFYTHSKHPTNSMNDKTALEGKIHHSYINTRICIASFNCSARTHVSAWYVSQHAEPPNLSQNKCPSMRPSISLVCTLSVQFPIAQTLQIIHCPLSPSSGSKLCPACLSPDPFLGSPVVFFFVAVRQSATKWIFTRSHTYHNFFRKKPPSSLPNFIYSLQTHQREPL